MKREPLDRLVVHTEDAMVRLQDAHDAGGITLTEFRAAVFELCMRARDYALQWADWALADELTTLTGQTVTPLGMTLPDDTPRVVMDAAAEALSSEPYAVNAVAAVAVLGRSQALGGAQDGLHRLMPAQGVQSWTRDLNDGACELCRDLAGDVLPATAQMYHHKGCGCTQRPVTTERNPA